MRTNERIERKLKVLALDYADHGRRQYTDLANVLDEIKDICDIKPVKTSEGLMEKGYDIYMANFECSACDDDGTVTKIKEFAVKEKKTAIMTYLFNCALNYSTGLEVYVFDGGNKKEISVETDNLLNESIGTRLRKYLEKRLEQGK